MKYLYNVYKQFLEHTKLLDAVYKTVFIQVDDIFTKIAAVNFKSLTYILDNKEYTWNFNQTKQAPVYVVEMIKNLFENFYTLPSNSHIILTIEFNGIDYIVESKGETVYIPEQLQFIKQYELSPYFFVERGVYEPINEFDRYFKFLDILCKDKSFLIPELQNLLEQVDVAKQNIYNTDDSSVMDNQQLVFKLKKSMLEIKAKIDDDILAREKLAEEITQKGILLRSVNSIRMEYDMCAEELYQLQNQQKELNSKLVLLQDTIGEVDRSLHNTSLADADEDTIYLREKRHKLVETTDTINSSIAQLDGFIKTLTEKIKPIELQLKMSGDITDDSVEALKYKLTDITNAIAKNEALVSNYDAKIKEYTAKIIDAINTTEKEPIVESDVLVSKLASAGYSKPITIVYNYIRNIFSYSVSTYIEENMSTKEYNKFGDYEIIMAQLGAMRKAFRDVLNLSPMSYFSIINDTNNAIMITRG